VEFDGRACTARDDLSTGFVMRVPAR